MSKEVKPASEVKPQSNKAGVGADVAKPPTTDASVNVGQEPKTQEASVAVGKPVRFMRNTGPVTPTITFEDGTIYPFPSRTQKVLDSVEDEVLIAKIRAVARKFRVYEDKN